MKRCVFDTNVWISAWITPGGTCEKLVMAARRGDPECVVSQFILKEIDEVLRVKFKVPDTLVEERLRFVLKCARMVETRTKVAAIRGHPADNHILECAVDGQADIVVTGDHGHLLPLKVYQGIRIMSPRETIDALRL